MTINSLTLTTAELRDAVLVITEHVTPVTEVLSFNLYAAMPFDPQIGKPERVLFLNAYSSFDKAREAFEKVYAPAFATLGLIQLEVKPDSLRKEGKNIVSSGHTASYRHCSN
jgi:hypothetical protein